MQFSSIRHLGDHARKLGVEPSFSLVREETFQIEISHRTVSVKRRYDLESLDSMMSPVPALCSDIDAMAAQVKPAKCDPQRQGDEYYCSTHNTRWPVDELDSGCPIGGLASQDQTG
ncbi:hypothetical protein [uncultured Sulfitobacter sp.]|uniref:hypothetical protein n=1 Tax=uncultured Sulfitobacter sp. TaxID=191468 RepID=UPI0025912F74|nr:hypothetical protein [uncultured Sulfitobacter sp.]